MRIVGRTDRYQRRHTWLGFPIAVIYKFFDDRGPHLAAQVTYYGFVSLFPLLLLFFSALGFFLDSNPALRNQLVNSTLHNFPVIGSQLRSNVNGLNGNGVALTIGIVGTLYGGLGGMQAAQAAFNQVYGIPRNEQPNPFRSRLRSLGLLALLGTAVLVSTAVAVLVATGNSVSAQFGNGLRVAGYALSFAMNVALFTAAFRLLTATELRIRHVINGGIIAAATWELLQTFGSRYIAVRLAHASSLYGAFGFVLSAIAWIYLEAIALILAAEINVVLNHRLWPRALLTPFTDSVTLTGADRRAYTMYAAAQRFKGFESVTADFARSDGGGVDHESGDGGSGSRRESDDGAGDDRLDQPRVDVESSP